MIVLLYNSYSSAGKGFKLTQQIISILNNSEIVFEHYCDNWPEKINADSKIWIIGGDGTVNYFLNKYGLLPNLTGLFPGGTGNDLYMEIYGNRKVNDQTEYLLKCSQSIKADVGICNGEYFLNGVGVGFDGEVLKKMKSIRKIGGHLGYLIQVIKTIFNFNEIVYSIDFVSENLESIQINKSLLLLNIANSSRTGGGFQISPLAKINDGLLNIVLCHQLSVFKRLRYLPVIEKGNHLALPFIEHFRTTHVQFTPKNKCYYQLDGELRQATVFNIELAKDKIDFLFQT